MYSYCAVPTHSPANPPQPSTANHQGSTAAFTSALSRLDGPSMAAALVALVADCGGADAAPLQASAAPCRTFR